MSIVRPRVAFADNVALGTFHPKTIVFFVAFAPQFVSPDGSYAVQAAILVATFGAVVAAPTPCMPWLRRVHRDT